MFKLIKSINLSKTASAVSNQLKQTRTIYLNSVLNLKKIEKTEDKSKKMIVIEGKYLDTKENDSKLLKFDEQESTSSNESSHLKPCAFCELEKRDIYVQYTDILVLRQFLTDDGQVLPRKVTGLCKRQQRKLLVLTKLAKHAGLILNLQPTLLDGSKPSTNPSKREKYLKWNTYFDSYEKMLRTKKFV